MTPPLRFFIPLKDWPASLPSSPQEFWPWALREGLEYMSGRYVITIRTWLELQAAGFPCELTNRVPQDGIVVTHSDFLPHTAAEEPWNRRSAFDQWLDDTFIVCFQADRPRYLYANIRLVQNRADATGQDAARFVRRIRPSLFYLPFWTQAGLLPRDRTRGDEFINIAFFGHPGESDPSLSEPAWIDRLRRLGLQFRVRTAWGWHDFREVDAVLAVRSFHYRGKWLWKPPTKLFNAWLAGVPAVLGRESAYRAERESELDYLEVRSRADVEAALLRLRDDPKLRAAMVEHGRRRSERVTAEAFTARWLRFVETEAGPAYEQWRHRSRLARRIWRWEDSARTRAETAIQTTLMTAHCSREVFRHRKDWN